MAIKQAVDNVVWHMHAVSKQQRSHQKHQKPCLIWFTGLSGSGKSTIANALDAALYSMDYHCCVLDGDNIRHGLNNDLGFSSEDRIENIRRIGEVSKLFVDTGIITIAAFISPYASDRLLIQKLLDQYEFIEVYVSTPISVCEERDPKGLYSKARKGEIKNFTGIDSEYEEPENPDIVLDTSKLSVNQCVDGVLALLKSRGMLGSIAKVL